MLQKMIALMIFGTLAVCLPAISWSASTAFAAMAPSGAVSNAVSGTATVSGSGDYIIGPGDVLDISVWKDEALTRSCVVRPDGDISFPLVGDVQAAGRTPSGLRAEIEKKLYQYVPRAVLSLEVKQINSLIFYVIGKVNTPGRFVMSSNIDVLQALATAGGLNIFANRNKIKIFRQGKNETAIFPFEYDKVVDGKHLKENIKLKRGDVVVVP